MSKEETIKYKILNKEDNLELRYYDSRLMAEICVTATSYNDAANIAFDHLSSYLYGNNITKDSTEGVQMEMQTPIEIEKDDSNDYFVRFLLSTEFDMHTAPIPTDPRIKICKIKDHKAAVITFRGNTGDKSIESKRSELVPWIRKNDLQPMGHPLVAFYSGPYTLWFLKTSEVIYRVK